MKKKILITGVTGYIGSQLAKALLADHYVYGLVRQPLNQTYLSQEMQKRMTLLPYDGSCKSAIAALKVSQPDIVYHLAAHYTTSHSEDVLPKLIESDLALGIYLLEAMCSAGCRRLVYASTVTTHYTGAGYRPLTLYAAMKQAFSDLVEFYTSSGLLNAAAVALSDTYGPGDQRPKVLNLIRQAAVDKVPLDLTSGRQIFDAVYIDDVIRGFIQASAALEGEAGHYFFQLASERPCSLQDTVALMLQENNIAPTLNWGAKPDPNGSAKFPCRIYPAPPDWRPEISLEKGLRRFWDGAEEDLYG